MPKKQFKSLYPRLIEASEGKQSVNYCGVRCSMEVLGGKWKFLIVAELSKNTARYTDLKKAIPEISEKMLIQSLQELEYHEIIQRKVLTTKPLRVEYLLTEYGKSVLPMLEMLFKWGESHIQTHSDKIFL